jgi:CRP-like cAMP-binding protein
MSVWRRNGTGAETLLAKKEPGSCFGEVGLLKNVPRTASVIAETNARVLRFTADEFLTLMREHDLTPDDVRSLYYARYIKSLLSASLARFSDAIAPESMQWRQLAAGEYMFRQGEPSDAFYIVVEGTADVISESGGASSHIATLHPGAFFGEMGILNSQPRGASVRAKSELKALRLDRDVFLATLHDNPEALSDLALITCRRLLEQVRSEPE